MQRPIITVPPAVFRATSVDWDIDWREQNAGIGTGGRRNILIGALPRWIGSPSLVLHAEALRLWRAHRWAGRGMTGIYRLTMVDPVGLSGAGRSALPRLDPAGVPFADQARFGDGAGFAPGWQIRCLAGAPAGATEILVDETDLPAPLSVRVGQILSHDDWPFGVTSRRGAGAGQSLLSIEMPLRRAIPAGGLIDIEATGLFELVDPRSGNPAYDLTRVARPSLSLQEWLR